MLQPQQQRHLDEERFQYVCQHYEIKNLFAHCLRTELCKYKVVLICDDSGSMNQLTDYREPRWNELCRFVTTVFTVTECVENSPLDVHFLNRGGIMGVQRLEQISQAFAAPPNGPTPIVPVFRAALRRPYDSSYQGRIFIICTDGEPTDQGNHVNTEQLRQVLLKERAHNDYVTFLACTDDDDAIGYLNRWDKQIPRLDVVDDYANEKKEVQYAQGRHFAFTPGDYVVKILLGSVVPALDKLDEYPDVDCTQVGCVLS